MGTSVNWTSFVPFNNSTFSFHFPYDPCKLNYSFVWKMETIPFKPLFFPLACSFSLSLCLARFHAVLGFSLPLFSFQNFPFVSFWHFLIFLHLCCQRDSLLNVEFHFQITIFIHFALFHPPTLAPAYTVYSIHPIFRSVRFHFAPSVREKWKTETVGIKSNGQWIRSTKGAEKGMKCIVRWTTRMKDRN